jgi:hypothetical protein
VVSSSIVTVAVTNTVVAAIMTAELDQKVLEEQLFKRFKGYTWSERTRTPQSWIWSEGYDIQSTHDQRWVCKTCIRINRPKPASFKASGLQNARSHLWKSHQIGVPEGEKKSDEQLQFEGIPNQPFIASLFNLDVLHQRDQQLANTLIRSFDKQYLYRLLVEFIVSSNLPFALVDNGVFRKILEYLNPSVRIRNAVPSSTTIRRSIYRQYKKHLHTVIEVFNTSPGKIHISFDGWTSPNQASMYGVVCFFRNEQNQLQKLLLGVPKASRHYGDTIAGKVLDILHKFRIIHKVGYCTLDNAENNTTAMDAINHKLGFNGRLRRGRCIGHIVNLAAKALLFGKNPDAFKEQLDGTCPLTALEYQLWREKGPMGKLHNLVVDVRNMHRLVHLFQKIQRKDQPQKTPLRLIIDNDTRWLLQLYMIRRALLLKTSLKLLLLRARKEWDQENMSRRTGKVILSKLAKLPRYLQEANQLTERD